MPGSIKPRLPETAGVYKIDAPAMIMFQYKAPRCYGELDVEHTPKMRIYSDYYADDDRIEVIGEKGMIFINRYTARTVDLPELMLFKDGKTSAIPVQGVEWHDSFTATTIDFIEKVNSVVNRGWMVPPVRQCCSSPWLQYKARKRAKKSDQTT